MYEPFKKILGGNDKAHTPFWKKLLSGGASGLVGSALINPLDVLKTRLNIFKNIRKIQYLYYILRLMCSENEFLSVIKETN